MAIRARLLSALVMPATFYGSCVGGMSATSVNALTTAVMRAIWGTTRKLRCRDIVLTLFVQGHLVDPRQAYTYQSLCALRRHMQKDPELAHVMQRCWYACVVEGLSAPGPIGIIWKQVRSLGWSWPEFGCIEFGGRGRLPLLLGPDSWWKHQLREGLRCALWAEAGSRRNDMQGLEARQGLDRKATMGVLGKRLPPDEVGLLRGILSGSIRLQKRLHEAKLVQTPTCSFCGMCDESVRHCFWECPKWAPIRDLFTLPGPDVRASWPACTIDCGLFVEDERVLDLFAELVNEHEEVSASDVASFFKCHDCRAWVAATRNVHQPQKIWTDGASSNNQDDRFRRAGCGIFYGTGSEMNLHVLLPGLVQSNQRAELLAVVLSCLRDPRPLDIRTDSEYVCKGFSSFRQWGPSGWHGDNADLWNVLASELSSRGSAVHVSWVKGHAKQVDIERGRTTEEDKLGNDGADALAVKGAQLHPVPSEVLESATQRKQWASAVQQMMVAVLQARLLAESACDTARADRGSECDDCEELYLDDVACGLDLSGTEVLHVSGTEFPGSCILNDECDEGAGTCLGVVE